MIGGQYVVDDIWLVYWPVATDHCPQNWRSPMINGSHIVIYSKDPEADRAFFRDLLKVSFRGCRSGLVDFCNAASRSCIP